MYQIPDNFKKFNINRYFSETTDICRLVHPDWPFLKCGLEAKELVNLLAGIEKSLSLNRFEKIRALRHELSSWQATELIEVFEDEKAEFKKLIKNEREAIFDLAVTAAYDWEHDLLPALLEAPCDLDETDKLSLLSTIMAAHSINSDENLDSCDRNISLSSLIDHDESTPDIDDFFNTPELDDDFNEYELLYGILTDQCDEGDEDEQSLLEALMAADPDCDGGPP